MIYPELAKELVGLLDEDQIQFKAFAARYYALETGAKQLRRSEIQLRAACKRRARKMLNILEKIGKPTLSNIGKQASEAITVLALHANYQVMKHVLAEFRECEKQDSANVHLPSIPALVDRIQILEGHEQVFGSQWLEGDNGKPSLYPVHSLRSVNTRRTAYGLKALRRPRIMAFRDAARKAVIPATADDMRPPTTEELKRYVGDYMDEW